MNTLSSSRVISEQVNQVDEIVDIPKHVPRKAAVRISGSMVFSLKRGLFIFVSL